MNTRLIIRRSGFKAFKRVFKLSNRLSNFISFKRCSQPRQFDREKNCASSLFCLFSIMRQRRRRTNSQNERSNWWCNTRWWLIMKRFGQTGRGSIPWRTARHNRPGVDALSDWATSSLLARPLCLLIVRVCCKSATLTHCDRATNNARRLPRTART